MSRVEILTIGDELTEGRLTDTNAGELSTKLVDLGLAPARHVTVADDMDEMVVVLREAAARCDAVLVSGGLGPTSDDLTALAAARAFGMEIERSDEALEHTRRFFTERGREMPATNEKQADLPRGSVILPNPEGTAVGFRLDAESCRLYFMPGVPRELRRMAAESVMPDLISRFETRAPLVSTLKLFGLGESEVAQRLTGIEEGLPEEIALTVQYRATFPEIHVRLVLESADGDAGCRVLERLTAEAQERFGDNVFAIGGARLDTDFPTAVAEAAAARGLTIAAAEVSSGGIVAALLSATGAGPDAFAGSCVAPDCTALAERLGLGEGTAEEIAAAVRDQLGAGVGLATLGSMDDTDGLRPGTIVVAAAGPETTESRELYFPIARARFQKLAAYAGLRMVEKVLRA